MSSTVNSVPEMDAILAKLDEITELEKKIASVKLEIDTMVPDLKRKHPDFVAKLSTKDGYKGSWYSIRARYNADLGRQIHYVCKTDKAFGSWLKKDKGKSNGLQTSGSGTGGTE